MVTFLGYLAWRDDVLGSYFVRTLVYVFCKYAHKKHINDMFTEVMLMFHTKYV